MALPYWNWAEDAARPDPTVAPVWGDDLMGGNGDPADNGIVKTGPFRQEEWTIVNGSGGPAGPLIRAFGVSVATLPWQTDVDNVLNVTPYDTSPWNWSSQPSFRNRLEGWYAANGPGLHNRAHVWVGGSMLPMTSPNDPVFFLHHCFVDKLWADWQAQHPDQPYLPQSGGPAGQNYNDLMERTVYGQVTPADVWNHHTLGYVYDQDVQRAVSGVYTVQQKSSSRFVDAYQSSGFSAVTRPAQNNEAQKWSFTPIGTVYTIQQKSSNRFLDALERPTNDYSIVTRTEQNNVTQEWIFIEVDENTYTIQQKSNRRYADAYESANNDFSLMTRRRQNNDTQKWIVLPVTGQPNTYTIQQKSSNRFVDAYQNRVNDFSAMTRTAQQNETQEWILTPVAEVCTIQQESNNRFLDAHQSRRNDYSVVTRNAQNNDTQKWLLTYLGNDAYTLEQQSSIRFMDAHENEQNDYSIVTRLKQNNDTQCWILTR